MLCTQPRKRDRGVPPCTSLIAQRTLRKPGSGSRPIRVCVLQLPIARNPPVWSMFNRPRFTSPCGGFFRNLSVLMPRVVVPEGLAPGLAHVLPVKRLDEEDGKFDVCDEARGAINGSAAHAEAVGH
eukprot:gnl/TRDRNA2_/TRDRNA2_177897_c3_seq1.p2 gnl/TRDRNA2_/TRDRNA2_177897_c3~~gnl/TRDRNA2_/TRDRNA2_177897_c3_seq1.p2  ORF type:complete len:126 (+),score=7.58 gnl/TRDRNA2_/TRDRNA2_177897_c3_seq1:152-529(+)